MIETSTSPGRFANRPRDVVVRVAGLSDAAELASLDAIARAEAWSVSRYRTELSLAPSRIWVAQRSSPNDGGSGQVAGLLCRWIMGDELEIQNVAVAIAARRRGIARRLLVVAIEDAVSRGARRALLEVRESNAAAKALYESFGFRQTGRRLRYYPDREDALHLERSLEPSEP